MLAASIVRGDHAIVISTGSDASAVPAEFREWPVLRKPFTIAAICTAIRSAAAIHSCLVNRRDAPSQCTLAL